MKLLSTLEISTKGRCGLISNLVYTKKNIASLTKILKKTNCFIKNQNEPFRNIYQNNIIFMEKNFYAYLEKYHGNLVENIRLNEDSIERLNDCSRIIKLTRGEMLQMEGEVSKIWGFVTQGLVRTYYKKGDTEVTEKLSHEGDNFIDYESFFRKTISNRNIQTIEPSVIFMFKYNELERICDEDKEIKKLFRRLKNENLIKVKERLDDSVFESAKLKFMTLLEKTPQYVLRVPSIFIASYLGITPETLSRIRAKMRID